MTYVESQRKILTALALALLQVANVICDLHTTLTLTHTNTNTSPTVQVGTEASRACLSRCASGDPPAGDKHVRRV